MQETDLEGFKWALNSNTTDKEDSPEELQRLQNIYVTVLFVGATLLFIIGVPGNVLTLIVLSKKVIKDVVLSQFLSFMCVHNILSLLVCTVRHLLKANTGSDLVYQNFYFCWIMKWVVTSLHSVTGWNPVFLTLCRLLFLVNRTRRCYTCLHPYLVVVCYSVPLFLIQAICLLNVLSRTDPSGNPVVCYLPHKSIWVVTMALVYGIIPTVYLIVCNFCLVYLYHRTKSGLLPSSKSLKIKKQILVIMLSSNFGAVFTLLPAAIFHTTVPYLLEYRKRSEIMKLQIVFQTMVFLIYANNASNFLIYCCFSQKFRKKTVYILKSLAAVFRRDQTTDERSPSDMTSSQFFKEEGRTVSGANQQMEVKYIWSANNVTPEKPAPSPSPSHETPDQQMETYL